MHCLFDLKFRNFSTVFVYILTITALFVFLYGFFPLKFSSNLKTNRYIHKTQNFKHRYIDKLAFIVIDGLRYDFVKPNGDHRYMPFTLSSILNNQSCYMVTKAHSPTVTLPRLKAITSGSVSTYVDVVLNFMTPALEEDNFINIAVSGGLKIVFYGDETWLKLFPNAFARSEGTNSFFTYDYVEVDSNVTRHIENEFRNNDWDIIILHYLGLDHIGHTEGPSSPLVIPKLIEMDDIIKKFNNHFKKLERSQGLKTMLVVTGDHGMKDSGSHGGVTYPEVTVPLVSVGNPCVVLPGWPDNHTPLQIDLAPTLSAAFGLPIPINSMGKIIPGLLHNMVTEDILKNLELNRLELEKLKSTSKKDETSFLKSELENWFLNSHESEKSTKNITKKYFQTLNQISKELVSSNSDFKLIFLVSGVTLLWASLIYMLSELRKKYPKPQSYIHWFFIIGTVLHSLSLFSTSFIEEEHQTWYFFWMTFCIFVFLESLKFLKNESIFHVFKFLFLWIIIALLHRILRKLNQTGDKWASLIDIKFYLHSEGQQWLFFSFFFGLCMVFCCALSEGCRMPQLITYGISLLAVTGYRIATKNFKMQYLFLYPSSRGTHEVCIFWIFVCIFTLQTAYNKTPFYLVWLVFTSLFLRPHNIILLPVEVFVSKTLHKLFKKSQDTVWNTIAHVWLAYVFYFYQGNGNSLSNVDVAAGFVGIQTYNPLYAGIMIVAHTFNSFILAYILSPKSNLIFFVLKIIPLTVYCSLLIFQLHHLFIWSVFSPKLLYESSLTVLFLMLIMFSNFFNCFKLPVR